MSNHETYQAPTADAAKNKAFVEAQKAKGTERYIQRHSLLARITHGVVSISCILLAISGLFVFVPPLAALVGADAVFTIRMSHRVLGCIFILMPVISAILAPKGAWHIIKEDALSKWDSDDKKWMLLFLPYLFLARWLHMPDQHQNKSGQRFADGMLIILSLLMAVTGVVLTLDNLVLISLSADAHAVWLLLHDIGFFLITVFGGAIFGCIVGVLANWVFESSRQLGWETTTTRILMELFLPFLLYLGAEAVHVSGILSVVAAGLVIRFDRTGIGPNVARTNIVASSVWSVLSFSLNGAVFILLGMLLPGAMRASWDNPMVSNYTLLAVILCVSTLIVGLRFLWVSGMLRLARAQDSHKRRRMTPERWRSAAVMTFGGAKGTITLSLMFTIPYTIADGEWFPMRDELIFIAGGVIIVTLLLSNFLLPVIAPNKAKDVPRETTEASIEVLRRTVEELAELTTDENRSAVMVVINSYTQRIGRLKNQLGTIDPSARIELQIDALNWEKEYVKRKLAEFRLDPTLSEREREVNVEACERLLDQIMDTLRHTNTKHDSSHVVWQVKGRAHLAQRRLVLLSRRAANTIRRSTPLVNENEIYASLRNLELGAFDHVIDRLYEEMSSNTYGTEYVSSLLMDYRRAEAALKSRPNMANSASLVTQIEDVKRESFGIELSVIQNMVEAGDITRAQARQLRKNVYVMSVAADSNF